VRARMRSLSKTVTFILTHSAQVVRVA